MTYPAGITPITCRVGKSVLAVDGDPTALTVVITPQVTGVKRLTHNVTGDQVSLASKKYTVPAGETQDFQLIPTNHPNLVDGAGNLVTGWNYKAQITQEYGRTSLQLDPVYFSPLTSQVGVIDVDLLPDGSIASPELATQPAVTSVLGETGAVTVTDLADPLLAEMAPDILASTVTHVSDGSALDVSLAAKIGTLKAWAKDVDNLIAGTITYTSGLVSSAVVEWPDGVPGVLTIDTRQSGTDAVTSYHVTRVVGATTTTYTQPTITRDVDGNATSVPQITVA